MLNDERTTPLQPLSSKNAYATLLTRPNYLAGAVLLAYTLHKYSPSTPLIIMYTPSTLNDSSIRVLEAESSRTSTIIHPVEHLQLPQPSSNDKEAEGKASGMVAERFADTWTKLRVFQLQSYGYEKICFLDADMMIFRDPSPLIFDSPLKPGNEMLATHVCVCNLDHDAWAPEEWKPENCAYSSVTAGEDGAVPEVVPDSPTLSVMNTGTFVFRASKEIEKLVFDQFYGMGRTRLASYKFPDQDFLNDVFKGRWASLHWSTNSLKTWKYWHGNMWRDEDVRVLHYIVDKPWAKRVGKDGRAGYKGDDGVTHTWWWEEFERWRSERNGEGREGKDTVLGLEKYVASANGEGDDHSLKVIGGGAQDFAKKWQGSNELEDLELVSHGFNPRKPMVGEHGHGPVVIERPQLSAAVNQPQLNPSNQNEQ